MPESWVEANACCKLWKGRDLTDFLFSCQRPKDDAPAAASAACARISVARAPCFFFLGVAA